MRYVSLAISMVCLISALIMLYKGNISAMLGWLNGFTGWGLLYLEECRGI